MSDGDKDALATVLVVEKPILVAALTALFLAGSAYLWRAKISRSDLMLVPLQTTDADEYKQSSDANADAEKPKNTRSKERRRRGKDPLRDILKNDKKFKALSKIPVVAKASSPVPDSSPSQPAMSVPSSSRSVSASRIRTQEDEAIHEPSSVTLVSGTDPLEPSLPPPDNPCDPPATHSQCSSTSHPSPRSESRSSTLIDISPINAQGSAMPSPVSRTVPSSEEGHSLLQPPPNVLSRSPRRASGVDSVVVPNGFHGSRNVPTPGRVPTPSSGTNTPPPSVIAQTQLASLRGALEAARQREVQMKSDLERYAKDLEFMRWESTSWRRRELELQNQVNYLSHQLQAIAASFSPMPSKSTVVSSPAPNGKASSSSSTSSSSANASPAKNGYHVPLPPQNPPQGQPSSLHIIPPPSGLFSPVPMMHSPVYYSYPPIGGSHSHHNYPHFSTQNQPHPHSFGLSQSQPANLISVFSPNGSAGPSSGVAHSGPSSAPDSSPSIGSLSPDGANLAVDRGRRRMRGMMHTRGWAGIGTEEEDGYLQEGGGYEGSSDDGESEVSEVLADAILKRPGTLKLGKSKSRTLSREATADGKSSPESETQAEFTFPSLSAFGGNIKWDKKPKDNENGSTTAIVEESTSSLDDLEKVEELDMEAQKSAMENSQSNASELPAG